MVPPLTTVRCVLASEEPRGHSGNLLSVHVEKETGSPEAGEGRVGAATPERF